MRVQFSYVLFFLHLQFLLDVFDGQAHFFHLLFGSGGHLAHFGRLLFLQLQLFADLLRLFLDVASGTVAGRGSLLFFVSAQPVEVDVAEQLHEVVLLHLLALLVGAEPLRELVDVQVFHFYSWPLLVQLGHETARQEFAVFEQKPNR